MVCKLNADKAKTIIVGAHYDIYDEQQGADDNASGIVGLIEPAKFLEHIHERLNVGGVLMLASPYKWLKEHTEQKNWVGGFKKDGESFTTFDGLQQMLSTHFRLVQGPQEVPFVIRETKRKYQHTLSEVTFWQRIV